jgi:hypothetical protein
MHIYHFVPPILARLQPRLQSRNDDEAITYASCTDALRACGGRGYEEADLARVICEKTKAYRDELARRSALKVSSTDAYGLLALAYCLTPKSGAKRSLTVVDFGGACRAYYFTFRKFFENALRLNWIVVETKMMCKTAAALASDELTFRRSRRGAHGRGHGGSLSRVGDHSVRRRALPHPRADRVERRAPHPVQSARARSGERRHDQR